jgi:hypothetical protein
MSQGGQGGQGHGQDSGLHDGESRPVKIGAVKEQ